MTARHHHYLPQGYLKRFTKGGSKKSQLVVIDLRQGKYFSTTPRNVGGARDFNRVDIPGVAPDAVENALSPFENEASRALERLDKGEPFSGEPRTVILNLIALLAIRSPERREHWRRFIAQVATRTMDLALATKERWDSQTQQMKENGYQPGPDVTYEEVKAFHEGGQYTIDVAREHHIRMEMHGVNAILPYLAARGWMTLRTAAGAAPFITTDNPVRLAWIDAEKLPRIYRDSPGFGMDGTRVYFPASKHVALIGEFDGPDVEREVTNEPVSMFNTLMLSSAYKQVFAPALSFLFRNADGNSVERKRLLR